MIDRGRVHDLAGESAGLDRLERLLAEIRQELAGMVAAAARLHGRLQLLVGAVSNPTAAVLASDWLDTQEGWRHAALVRAGELLARLARQRAILEGAAAGRRRRKVDSRRRSLLAAADHAAAELAGIAGALERSDRELRAALPIRLPSAVEGVTVVST